MGRKTVLLCDRSYITACVSSEGTPKGCMTDGGPARSVGPSAGLKTGRMEPVKASGKNALVGHFQNSK
jgi:hypothetical protein